MSTLTDPDLPDGALALFGCPSALANLPLSLCDTSGLDAQARLHQLDRLRALHQGAGVDPRYLNVPDDATLWFVHVGIDCIVHAGMQGCTRNLMEYALGANADAAIAVASRYVAYAFPQARVLRAHARPSACTHPAELSFPECVRRGDLPPRVIARTVAL